ncbi:KICSTOR complex protein kaptin-like [Styela clava]
MASSLDDLFHESNFHNVSSLTTIYGATAINGCNVDKLMVAMLKGKIVLFEYKKVDQSLVKIDKEVSFTYIPADAHVISIDCFTCGARGLIIAVAFFKETNGKLTNYLNIYCNYTYDASDEKDSCQLETVAENCRSFELEFVPFQLTHCKSRARKDCEALLQTVFIVLGGDSRIHVYAQDENQGEFSEQNLDKYFPEFKDLPGVPMFVDIKITNNEKMRISAVGHATGDISLFITDLSTEEWKLTTYHIQHDSPITSVRLFTKYTEVKIPEFMKRKFSTQDLPNHDPNIYHLLVTSAWENAVVYCFCADQGFEIPVLLENSSEHDCVTCCQIADIDRDGVNDIIIGTYGQELLVYKFNEPSSETYDPYEPVTLIPYWTRTFSYPIVNIMLQDLTGDGLSELIVISTKGLHILQCNSASAIKECKAKLLNLKRLKIK